MMYLKIIFSFVLFVPTFAFANGQSKPPINNCQEHQNIEAYCVKNTFWEKLKANKALASTKVAEQKTAQQNLTVKMAETENLATIDIIIKDCEGALRQCESVCDQFHQQATQAKDMAAANSATKAKQFCQAEAKKAMASAGTQKVNSTQLLLAALAILERLGLADGGGDSIDIPDLPDDQADDDPCNTPLAATMVSCVNASADDDGRRTGGSTTGVNPRGNLGDGGVGVAGGNNTDGIGGESKESGGNDGSFGGGFGGGLGVAGLPGGSGNGGSDNGGTEKSLDQKIAEGGYLNGGATGGGSGGGGSGIGGASPFAASGGGSAGLNPALNSQLNQAKKASVKPNRAPASAGGNGPFADLWSVVNKSYKKNKSSLFHQK